MYISIEKYSKAWDFIRQDGEAGGCTVLVLVGPDIDAIAGCKILSFLFQSELMSYKVKPIFSHEDLHEVGKTHIENNEELRSLILLNCGGCVDLVSFLPLPEEVTVYVFDAHRPHNLMNVQDKTGKILLFGDDEDVSSVHPPALPEGEDEEYEEDSDEESDEEEGGEGGGGEGGQGGEGKSRKRKRKNIMSKMRAPKRLKNYYMMSYYGTSASTLLFFLALQLSKRSNDLIWYAVLGLTDQYLHNRIDQRTYYMEMDRFRNEVNMLKGGGEEEEKEELGIQDGHISVEEDYKFSLYRHWSLYEAMRHSPYVATRLQIWKPSGDSRLLTLMAKMGIPLEQSQQTFGLMKKEFKDVLRSKIFQYADEFNIPEISFLSLTRRTAGNLLLSASDAVLALSALTEVADVLHNPQFSAFVEAAHHQVTTPGQGGDLSALTTESMTSSILSSRTGGGEGGRERWEANFWVGYDALSESSRCQGLLKEGLQLAMMVQRAVVRQAIELIKRKVIVRSGPFRYCLLTDHESDSTQDLSLFTHPLALSQLSNFLINSFHDMRAKKPFLIGVLNERNESYLVLGCSPPSSSSSTFTGNSFGYHFQEAAQQTKAQIVAHLFDRTLVEVSSDQISRFIGYIHLHMTT